MLSLWTKKAGNDDCPLLIDYFKVAKYSFKR